MSTLDTEIIEPVQDELSTLKARADLMGIKYHPTISLNKLRYKVEAAIDGEEDETEKEPVAPKVEVETDGAMRMRLRREASELVRIRVSCLNPAKKEWEGEILAAGNSIVGTHSKYVPFNNDEGWHVPRIIYNMMQDRQCQIFVTTKDSRGNTSRSGKLIKEFAIEVMPSLTPEELADLAQRQAMAKTID